MKIISVVFLLLCMSLYVRAQVDIIQTTSDTISVHSLNSFTKRYIQIGDTADVTSIENGNGSLGESLDNSILESDSTYYERQSRLSGIKNETLQLAVPPN